MLLITAVHRVENRNPQGDKFAIYLIKDSRGYRCKVIDQLGSVSQYRKGIENNLVGSEKLVKFKQISKTEFDSIRSSEKVYFNLDNSTVI